jgi:hypothetical protein
MYKGMGMSLDDNRKEQDKLTGKKNAKVETRTIN